MDFRVMGLESPLFHTLHHMMDLSDDAAGDKTHNAPTRSYVRDAKAMAATPADVKDHMMDLSDDAAGDKTHNAPTRSYVRDAKAMAATPADVKEYPNSYVFEIDMPGLKSGDIKVQVEDDNVLVISGERKREEDKQGSKYLKMERRVGKFMRKFVLPENANSDGISAVCQDGVLSVTVQKLPPPEPKKPRTIEVKVV